MQLQNEDDFWNFTFENCEVQIILIDFRLGLIMSENTDELRLEIGSQCHLNQSGVDTLLIPEETTSLAPVLSLFRAKVLEIEIQRTGKLSIRFEEGRSLYIVPDPDYEAWELGCPSIDMLFVCLPGGEVSQFAGKRTNKE